MQWTSGQQAGTSFSGLRVKLKSKQLVSRLICNILEVQVIQWQIELGNGQCSQMAEAGSIQAWRVRL